MPFTVTFTATAFVAGSLRNSSDTLLVDDQTARMLVDLGVATAPGLTAQTGAVAPNLARTDGATFTGELTLAASTTAAPPLNIPHGTAPSTLTNGDIWTTTTGLVARINNGTRTFAMRESGNNFTAGTKNTFSHSATTAGLNVGPVAGNPSSLANGDIWTNSTTGIMTARSNGMSGQVGAVKAWVNFNGTGTVAIRGSFNVTSITDNGVGNYTVNFTTAMIDTNYATFVTGTNYSDSTQAYIGTEGAAASTYAAGKTTTSNRVLFTNTAGSNDPVSANVAVLR